METLSMIAKRCWRGHRHLIGKDVAKTRTTTSVQVTRPSNKATFYL
jgi:ribosomal protein S13